MITAADINTVANEVYKHNFPNTNLFNKNIQSLSATYISQLNVNVILMSPPCQPFTRNGKFLDESDARADSFLYLISILDQLSNIEYILMENVKGFECSIVRNIFTKKLQECNFDFQEFLLSPTSVGVPNSRLRYYCIARRCTKPWNFKTKTEIVSMHIDISKLVMKSVSASTNFINKSFQVECLPREFDEPYCIECILEEEVSDKFLLKDQQLKRAKVLDVCHRDSRRSCCFTKAYSHYLDGTGSVFTEASRELVEKIKNASASELGSSEFIQPLRELKLRFFTPKEILALMSFPKDYSFPETVSTKQCYRLLGNSVNVRVISELLKILFN